MMKKFLTWLTTRLPVHEDGHLFHANGDPYMGRWIIVNWRWLHIRLHRLDSPDLDRHMHDHPAAFVSVVLSGEYEEARPVCVNPCFAPDSDLEYFRSTLRRAGSIAYRAAHTRHIINWVAPGTWTMFIFIGGRSQWWGYYTPHGKVWYRDYKGAQHGTVNTKQELREIVKLLKDAA